MPWSEHKPKLPSTKKRRFRSQHVGPYIRDFIRCFNFWNCARFRRAITKFFASASMHDPFPSS
jgi:hypothetical protein